MKKNLQDWLSWQEKLHLSEIDLGLDRIHQVADNLQLLKPSFPIITIAGTNGKGSSVAITEAILKAEGYKTGSYTSPHLIDYNERIKLDGQNVDDETIIHAFEQIDKARSNISLTYFEFSTLAAMLIFTQEKVDVAILEVGLGGRLDAANLWDASLALITSIDVDHVEWLGDDREKIAIEKAGIMRKNSPVISGEINPPLTIASEAKRIGARLFQINEDFSYSKIDTKNWVWLGSNREIKLPIPLLKGDFQLNNASTVIAGLLSIHPLLPVSIESIQNGLNITTINGRLEVISKSPEWLIDVAHNPHAAKELALFLNENPVKGKTYALFSMLADKDIAKVVSIMDRSINEWHVFGLDGARGLKSNELKQLVSQHSSSTVFQQTSLKIACETLKNITKTEDRVVAFGSFLVVSDVISKC